MRILVALGAVFVLTANAQRFDLGPARTVRPSGGVYHRFVTPGAAFDLEVSVLGEDGAPATSTSVFFLLPETGFGSFQPEGDPAWLRQVPLTDRGIAVISLVAPDHEAFYTVSAVAEGTTREVTFAITVLRDPPSPGWEPGDARAAAAQRFEIAPDSPGLFGPYWLPAHSTFGEANRLDVRTEADRDSFFFWYDPSPQADFFHRVRYLTLSGGAPPETASPVDARWWPDLRTPDGASQSRLLRALVDGSRSADLPKLTLSSAGTRTHRAEPAQEGGPCAIVAYGPGRSFYVNSVHMNDVFLNTLQIPADRVLGTADVTLPSELDAMIDSLVEKRCTKLYLYLSGHGSGGAVGLGNENDQDNDTSADSVFFDAVASRLQLAATRLQREGIKMDVSVIVQSCGAGSMIPALQGRGFDGEVLTASDDSSSAYGFPFFIGSLYTYQLAACWESQLSDLNGDGTTTLTELGACIEQRFLPNLAFLAELAVNTLPNPQVSRIYGAGLTLAVPSYTIPVGSTVTGTVQRPEWATGDLDVRVEVPNPVIATVEEQDFINLRIPAGQNTITFRLQGRNVGQVAYRVRILRDSQGKTAAQTGSITVTAPVSIGPATGTGGILDLGQEGSSVARIFRNGDTSSPAVFRLRTTDDSIGTGDVVIVPFEVTIPAGASSASFNVFGLRPGSTTILATSGDTRLTLPVVNPGFTLSDEIRVINVDSTASADVLFRGTTPPEGWTGTSDVRTSAVFLPNAPPVPLSAGLWLAGRVTLTARQTGGSLIELGQSPAGLFFYTGTLNQPALSDGPIAGFAVSGLAPFNRAGDRYGIDVAAGAANGTFVRSSTFRIETTNTDIFLNGQQLTSASTSFANVTAGPAGYARVEYAGRQPGPSSIVFRTAAGQASPPFTFTTVANPVLSPTEIRLLAAPAPVVVQQTGAVDFEVRRDGVLVNDTIFTCALQGGNFEFTGGSLHRRDTATQYTISGRIRLPIRAVRPGLGLLECFSGQARESVLLRTPFTP